MATCVYVIGPVLFLLISASTAHDVTAALMQHIERLDVTIQRLEQSHRAEIRELEEKLRSEYEQEIRQLKQRLGTVEHTCDVLKQGHGLYKTKQNIDSNRKPHGSQDGGKINGDNILNTQKDIGMDHEDPDQKQATPTRPTRALLDGYNVAFSAYMDHDVNGLGPGQTLVYNQVLLNDGGAYNRHSGMFTAPIAGVYHFTFFVGERDNEDEWVALWVNSNNTVDAAVQTMHTTQDLQGGNAVNLKLATGDIVFVKNLGNGHVEGSSTLRITTFTGHLIYPVESSVIVGK